MPMPTGRPWPDGRYSTCTGQPGDDAATAQHRASSPHTPKTLRRVHSRPLHFGVRPGTLRGLSAFPEQFYNALPLGRILPESQPRQSVTALQDDGRLRPAGPQSVLPLPEPKRGAPLDLNSGSFVLPQPQCLSRTPAPFGSSFNHRAAGAETGPFRVVLARYCSVRRSSLR